MILMSDSIWFSRPKLFIGHIRKRGNDDTVSQCISNIKKLNGKHMQHLWLDPCPSECYPFAACTSSGGHTCWLWRCRGNLQVMIGGLPMESWRIEVFHYASFFSFPRPLHNLVLLGPVTYIWYHMIICWTSGNPTSAHGFSYIKEQLPRDLTQPSFCSVPVVDRASSTDSGRSQGPCVVTRCAGSSHFVSQRRLSQKGSQDKKNRSSAYLPFIHESMLQH